MQVGARSVRPQLQKSDSLETEADDWALFRIPVTLVPDAPFRLQQIRMLGSEAIETGTAETILAFDEEAETDGQFAEGLLIRLDRSQPRHEIAFAVCGAARIKFAVDDAGGEWAKRPVS